MYATAHSYFSLRYGTLTEEELPIVAKQHGFSAIALTDINNSSAVFPFIRACQEQGVQPLIGIEFRKDNQWTYTGIAKNEQGLRELNEYLTHYNLSEKPLPETAGKFDNAFIIYPLSSGKKAEQLRENEYLGVQPAEVNKTVLSASKKLREK